jgi:hypothetical protein
VRFSNLRGYLFFWVFFTGFASVVQLWTLLFYRFQLGQPLEIVAAVSGGAMIFYANALCAQVIRDSWSDARVFDPGRFPLATTDFYVISGVPLIVLVFGTVTYLSLLQSPTLERPQWTQWGLAAIAVASSLRYHIRKYRYLVAKGV